MDTVFILGLAISLIWFLMGIFTFDACWRMHKYLKTPDLYVSRELITLLYRMVYVIAGYGVFSILKGIANLPFSWIPKF